MLSGKEVNISNRLKIKHVTRILTTGLVITGQTLTASATEPTHLDDNPSGVTVEVIAADYEITGSDAEVHNESLTYNL